MLQWVSANLTTIIICAVIILAVVLSMISIIRDKKKGRSSCGCSCAGCPMNGQCHTKQK